MFNHSTVFVIDLQVMVWCASSFLTEGVAAHFDLTI